MNEDVVPDNYGTGQPQKINRNWSSALFIVCAAFLVAYVIFLADGWVNRGVEMNLGASGLKIRIEPDTDINRLIAGLLAEPSDADNPIGNENPLESREHARGITISVLSGLGYINPNDSNSRRILNNAGFHYINDQSLIDALTYIGTSTDHTLSDDQRQRIRKLLYSLDGPFKRPHTLEFADKRLADAIEDIERSIRVSNEFLATLVERSLKREGIFRVREFNVSLERVSTPEAFYVRHLGDEENVSIPVIFGCVGSPLIGTEVIIYIENRIVEAVVHADPRGLDCKGDFQPIKALIDGAHARIGFSPDMWNRVFNDHPEDSPGPIGARLQVRPLHDSWHPDLASR